MLWISITYVYILLIVVVERGLLVLFKMSYRFTSSAACVVIKIVQ